MFKEILKLNKDNFHIPFCFTCLYVVKALDEYAYNQISLCAFYLIISACVCPTAVVKPGKEHAGGTLEIPSEESLHKTIKEAWVIKRIWEMITNQVPGLDVGLVWLIGFNHLCHV